MGQSRMDNLSSRLASPHLLFSLPPEPATRPTFPSPRLGRPPPPFPSPPLGPAPTLARHSPACRPSQPTWPVFLRAPAPEQRPYLTHTSWPRRLRRRTTPPPEATAATTPRQQSPFLPLLKPHCLFPLLSFLSSAFLRTRAPRRRKPPSSPEAFRANRATPAALLHAGALQHLPEKSRPANLELRRPRRRDFSLFLKSGRRAPSLQTLATVSSRSIPLVHALPSTSPSFPISQFPDSSTLASPSRATDISDAHARRRWPPEPHPAPTSTWVAPPRRPLSIFVLTQVWRPLHYRRLAVADATVSPPLFSSFSSVLFPSSSVLLLLSSVLKPLPL